MKKCIIGFLLVCSLLFAAPASAGLPLTPKITRSFVAWAKANAPSPARCVVARLSVTCVTVAPVSGSRVGVVLTRPSRCAGVYIVYRFSRKGVRLNATSVPNRVNLCKAGLVL